MDAAADKARDPAFARFCRRAEKEEVAARMVASMDTNNLGLRVTCEESAGKKHLLEEWNDSAERMADVTLGAPDEKMPWIFASNTADAAASAAPAAAFAAASAAAAAAAAADLAAPPPADTTTHDDRDDSKRKREMTSVVVEYEYRVEGKVGPLRTVVGGARASTHKARIRST